MDFYFYTCEEEFSKKMPDFHEKLNLMVNILTEVVVGFGWYIVNIKWNTIVIDVKFSNIIKFR